MPVRWQELEEAVEKGSGHDLYFHPDAALSRVRELGDLFRPVLEVEQALPEAFMAGTTRSRKPARVKAPPKVLSLPSPSRQGSRRRFWLGKAENRWELKIELHEQVLMLSLWKALPAQKNSVAKAELLRGRMERTEVDEGTCEIVEGSLQKGYLRLYFAGRKIKGEWIFEREDDIWLVRKR